MGLCVENQSLFVIYNQWSRLVVTTRVCCRWMDGLEVGGWAHLCDGGEALEEEEQGAVRVGQGPPLVHQLPRHTPINE